MVKDELETKITIGKKHIDFAPIYFVAEACSRDYTTRVGLTYLKVEKDKIVATNGHILHMYKDNLGLEEGCYEVKKHLKKEVILAKVKCKETDENPYPQYDRIIPRTLDDREDIDLGTGRYSIPDLSYTKVIRAMSNDCTINYEFFKFIFNSMCSPDIEGSFIAYINEELHSPLVFEHDKYYALIMPLRTNC